MNKLNTILTSVIGQAGHPIRASAITIYGSRVSLNTTYGCPIKCEYCVLLQDNINADPFRVNVISTVHELLAEYDKALRSDARLENLKISVGDHSDPFLPKVVADTLAILEGLAARGIKTPILLTTKLRPPTEILDKIAALDLKLTFFISIADTSNRNNRFDIDNVHNRLAALRDVKSRGIHTVLYIKPWDAEWTTPSKIAELVRENRMWIDEVVLSPLQGTTSDYYTSLKKISEIGHYGSDLENRLITEISKAAPDLAISRKRSCSINRRHDHPCRPPLFATLNSSTRGDLFFLAVPDDAGYCKVYPKESFQNIEPGVISALSTLSKLLQQSNITWGLIGSFQRALSNEGPVMFKDIDIAVTKPDLLSIIEILKNIDPDLVPYMGCKGKCSAHEIVPKQNWSVEVNSIGVRLMCRVHIGGIQFDITSVGKDVLGKIRYIRVAGLDLPLAESAVSEVF